MLRKISASIALCVLLATVASINLQAHERDLDSESVAAILSPVELKALIEQRMPVHVYDANGRDSYLEGHVPGAEWVDYDAVAKAALPEDKEVMLVFYCWNPLCGSSHTAAEQARALGYENVWRMPEGIEGWREAGLPVVVGSQPGMAVEAEADHVES